MNLLVDKPTNEICGYKIKTDFYSWVNLHIALKKGDNEHITECYMNLFDEAVDIERAIQDAPKVIQWLGIGKKQGVSNSDTDDKPHKQSFDFDFDGNIIFAELWRYFPEKMKSGLQYHEGIELIQYLCQMPHEQSQLSKRVFARCGDFSGLTKNEQMYWQELKTRYRIPLNEDEQDEINKIAEILKGDGDLTKLED